MVSASSNSHSLKKQRLEDETRCATLLDRTVLDCPICWEPLVIPIFQCDNGHLACHTCFPKLKNKCPVCAIPIGNNRNRAMEKVLESTIVPCPNTQLGCTENVPYGRESNHEKDYCKFSLCSCPDETNECNYTGYYDDTWLHYLACHLLNPYCFFAFGLPSEVQMHISEKILVRSTLEEKVLFVVQCFREPNGVYVTVKCIAPLAPEVRKYSYRISYTSNGHTHTHESAEMKRIRKVSFQIPQEKNFLFISNSVLRGEKVLNMEICISEVGQR
ncbi:hypothetical protein EUTSA_v10028229mg, partial [Eutrema salsugineum]